MDLLYHRYASPFSLLEQVVKDGELSEFVTMLWDVIEEEREWEYFLAKVLDKSFDEFRKSMKPKAPISRKELENTVKDSFELLDTFVPTEQKGEDALNGTV